MEDGKAADCRAALDDIERHHVVIGNFLGKPARSLHLRACSEQERGQERWLLNFLRRTCSKLEADCGSSAGTCKAQPESNN